MACYIALFFHIVDDLAQSEAAALKATVAQLQNELRQSETNMAAQLEAQRAKVTRFLTRPPILL
jgi:hypothetical protein